MFFLRLFYLFFVVFLLIGCGNNNSDPSEFCDPEPLADIFSCVSYTEKNFAENQVQELSEFVNSPSFSECTHIKLVAGTYVFEAPLVINKNGIILEGAGMGEDDETATILEFKNASATNAVDMSGENLVLKNLTVQNSDKNNIVFENSKRILVQNVLSTWDIPGGEYGSYVNGDYAIYPVLSKYVVLDNVVTQNSRDAGIYIGQSAYVVIKDSTAEYNVAGLEIENTCFFDVYNNLLVNNTGGLLNFDLAGKSPTGRSGRIFSNKIMNNNVRNFCSTGTVCEIPAGTGLILIATRDVEVYDNTFGNNSTIDIVMISGFVLELSTYAKQGGDAYVYNIYIRDNIFNLTSGYDINGLKRNFTIGGEGYQKDFGLLNDVELMNRSMLIKNENPKFKDVPVSGDRKKILLGWYKEIYDGKNVANYSIDDNDALIRAYKADLQDKDLAAITYMLADIYDDFNTSDSSNESKIEYVSLIGDTPVAPMFEYAIVTDGVSRFNLLDTKDTRNTNNICIGKNKGTRVPAFFDTNILGIEDPITKIFDESDKLYSSSPPSSDVIEVSVNKMAVDFVTAKQIRLETGEGSDGLPYGDYTCSEADINVITNLISSQTMIFASELFPDVMGFVQ